MRVIYLSNNIIMIFIFVLQRGLLDVLRRYTHRSFTSSLLRFSKWMTGRVFITFTARRLWNSVPNALENQSRFDSPAFHTANTTSQVFPQLNQQHAQIWNGLCVTQTHTMAMHKIPHDTCKCRPAPSVLCPSQHWKLMSGGTRMKTGPERVISLLICEKI